MVKKDLCFILVDDHAIVRRGLKQILKDEFPEAKIVDVESAEEVLKNIIESDFDLLVCDISMPGMNGLELIKEVKELRPKLPVLILSMHAEKQYAIRALRTGASGYLTKESAPEELIKAIHQILDGKKYVSPAVTSLIVNYIGNQEQGELHSLLSDRELEVLKLIVKGKSLTEIAEVLELSPNTISTYRTRVLEKLKIRNNAELVHYALKHQL